MSPEDQLVYESRMRNRQMVVAGGAGLLLLIAAILSHVGPHAKVNELTVGLIASHKRSGLDIAAAVVNGLGYVALGWTLVYLFRCARARAPQAAPYIQWLPAIGAPLAAVTGIAYAVALSARVATFVTTGSQTYDEASRVYSGGLMDALQLVALLAALLTAMGFVLVALQAMRVGLLPRFMGYVGMLAGALIIFQIGGLLAVIVQLYWLIAVAYLISGRWPSGLPAAWRTGRAEELPKAAEVRARRMAEAEKTRAQRKQGRGRAAEPDDAAATADDEPPPVRDGDAARSRSATSKRKRKRRR